MKINWNVLSVIAVVLFFSFFSIEFYLDYKKKENKKEQLKNQIEQQQRVINNLKNYGWISQYDKNMNSVIDSLEVK